MAVLGLALSLIPLYILAEESGSITLTAAVPVNCSISVTENTTNIENLSLGQTNLQIGSITENCNDPDGYSVTIEGSNSSSHTGKFIDTISGAQQSFTLAYNNQTVSSSIITNSNGASSPDPKAVTISFPPNPNLTGSVSNTYTETLTFTITAK